MSYVPHSTFTSNFRHLWKHSKKAVLEQNFHTLFLDTSFSCYRHLITPHWTPPTPVTKFSKLFIGCSPPEKKSGGRYLIELSFLVYFVHIYSVVFSKFSKDRYFNVFCITHTVRKCF